MTWFDIALVVVILTFLILIIWSRVQDQTMLDTVVEIKEIIAVIGESFKDKAEDVVKK